MSTKRSQLKTIVAIAGPYVLAIWAAILAADAVPWTADDVWDLNQLGIAVMLVFVAFGLPTLVAALRGPE